MRAQETGTEDANGNVTSDARKVGVRLPEMEIQNPMARGRSASSSR